MQDNQIIRIGCIWSAMMYAMIVQTNIKTHKNKKKINKNINVFSSIIVELEKGILSPLAFDDPLPSGDLDFVDRGDRGSRCSVTRSASLSSYTSNATYTR